MAFSSFAEVVEGLLGSGTFFVQVGANDGMTDDPIHEFVLRYGWHGILVEPLPVPFAALQKAYAGVEGLEFLQAAVTPQRGRVVFQQHLRMPQCSGLGVKTRLQRKAQEAGELVEVEVEGITCGDLAALVGSRPLGLLQIDVEGYDWEVLRRWPFGEVTPRVVRWEHKHLEGRDREAAEARVEGFGYRLVTERNDTFGYLVSG